MKLQIIFLFIITLFFTACSVKPLEPSKFEFVDKKISFTNDVKPILDKRCVSCHSCYNSPCQLKLSSFEGLRRGSSKEDIYANRLTAGNPTRLFVDAVNEREWREKGFFSITETFKNSNDSIMMQYLSHKMRNPKNIGTYSPEKDKLSCVKNRDELEVYLDKNPHKGMPYGFPALKKDEYNILMTWLYQGYKDDTLKNNMTSFEKEKIEKFEEFFNKKDIKHKVTARYIYEHLFLAHISFDDKSNNFYELVRSKTPSGKPVEIVATKLPYCKVKEPFYYRFRKIESTIVHKTHMVYKLNEKKLQRYKELFIDTAWENKKLASYEPSIAANALKAFEQIPAQSRYNFLLDDIHYIIMTFIRGPVCKGQIALNVIQDNFWVLFLDPKYDVTLHDKTFLHNNLENLSIPNSYGEDPSILKTFSILDNYEFAKKYQTNKAKLYKKYYPNGLPLEAVWRGNKTEPNDSILTIYRHFDSASVHKGAFGNIPKTIWLIDYPLLERIYYSLVAGFDVFGNTAHQLMVRKHMDRLRIEGESNFLEFLPKESRKKEFSSWYKGWLASYLTVYISTKSKTAIKYESKEYKKEFIEKLFKQNNIKKDHINFIETSYKPTKIKNYYQNKEDIEETFKALSLPNSAQSIKSFTDDESNLAYIKIMMNSGENLIYSMVINRWHDNVALLVGEESRFDTSKDNINFIEGFVGSYPNILIEVKQNDLPQFFDLIKNYQDTPKDNKRVLKYVVNRANPKFWESYDWFVNEFKKKEPLNYGLFDLNRYAKKAIWQ